MRPIRELIILAAIVLPAALAQASPLKIDAGLRATLHHGALGSPRGLARPQGAGTLLPERIPCFIRGQVTRAQLEAMGIPAGTEAGGVVGADLTWDDVRRLSEFPGVELIQLSRSARHHLNNSRVQLGADLINGGTAPNFTGMTGKNVVVGIVDTGIDPYHADFKDKNGLNRILYIWDQNTSGGAPSGFAYGKEWTASSITNSTCTQVDLEGHGTHVAGIAAGSGRATGNAKANYRYIGVAPEADIIMVNTDFSFNHIVDGVNYIFQKAAALGKPAVVNLSLGSNYGPHDGTESQDLQLNALTGPGKIVCVSAGNSGADSLHAETNVVASGSSQVKFFVPSYSPNLSVASDDYVVVDAYYKSGDNISVTIGAPDGWSSGSIPRGSVYTGHASASQGYVYVDNGSSANQPQPLGNGQYNLYIEIYDQLASEAPAPGHWTLTLTGNTITAGGHVDLWVADEKLGSSGQVAPWRQGLTATKEVSTPGTAESTLCVAAWTGRTTWPAYNGNTYQYGGGPYTNGSIAYFSSHGPSADNRQRPTIAAPGFGVISSRPSNWWEGNFTADDSVHYVNQGTSMACPQVTGVSALILQGHPDVPPTRVKMAIIATATVDGQTGSVPNGTWGYGKLSATAANSTTPTELFALDGMELEAGFQLQWAVAEGVRFDQFRVERGASGNGPWARINSEPIPGSARSYLDHPAPGTWFYRVLGSRAGETQSLGPFRAEVTGAILKAVRLLEPTPNPAHGPVSVSFVLPGLAHQDVNLGVFDVRGRRVATLASGSLASGRHDLSWDGRTLGGSPAGAGLYFVRLTTPQGTLHRKLAFVR